jgi:hypothetical protein
MFLTLPRKVIDKCIASIGSQIIFDVERNSRSHQKLKRSFNEIICSPVMHVKPETPSLGQPRLIEIPQPKLLTVVNFLLRTLCKLNEGLLSAIEAKFESP